jgi:hypothetical protein
MRLFSNKCPVRDEITGSSGVVPEIEQNILQKDYVKNPVTWISATLPTLLLGC